MKIIKLGTVLLCLLVLCLVVVSQSYAKIDPKTIVGAWFLDDKGDIAKDSSGNGNDGVIQGNPKSIDGKFGKALEFSGSNGVEINNPDKFEFLTWTYVLWFRAKAGGDYPNLIGRQFANNHGWTIHLDPGGATFRIRIDTDGGINQVKTVPKLVRDDEWHHGAIAHDDKNKKLQMYIDGVKGDLTYAGDYKNSGGFLKIAFAAVGAVNLKDAAIDDVGIFNVLLAEEDVINIMKNGLEASAGLKAVSPVGRLASTWGRIKEQ
ncbi:TPA: LamG domain-containing protein [bacterium]|nr:LamG domain-containing protein [bacterium]